MTGKLAGIQPEELMKQMTLTEKIGQLHMVSLDAVITGPAGPPPGQADLAAGRVGSVLNAWGAQARDAQRVAVEQTRLGVPLLLCLDVLHGHRTVFPIPLGEAASFNPALWTATAEAAALETARDGVHLTFAPMVDVSRDPRWGRISESAGEDALVNARFGAAKVAGFQGRSLADPRRIAATAKHFAAYGAGLGGREYESADVSAYAMAADYLPPFKAAVDAGVAAIMPAFLDVAGVPMSANRPLLVDVLRKEWGFTGVTIADYNAVAELISHGAAETGAEAAELAFMAGLDVDMVSGLYLRWLPELVASGRVPEAAIDAAVLRVLRLKQALGLFEDPWRGFPGPEAGATPEITQDVAPLALAHEAARQSLVLAQNPDNALPLTAPPRSVAIIGALAASRPDMFGAWAGSGDADQVVSVVDGLRAAWPGATFTLAGDDAEGAAAAARSADVAIVCIGETAAMSGEAAARAHPTLPEGHLALVQAAQASGARVAVVLFCGRPLVAPELFAAGAPVLIAWGPGSAAGAAIADVLTGRVAPSGRLPVTWPRAVGQLPLSYLRRPTGRPYAAGERYVTGYSDEPNTPQFPFGHGESYARFVWSNLSVRVDDAGWPDAAAHIRLNVRNAGAMDAAEVVFLFAHVRTPGATRPLLLLRDFARIEVAAGEHVAVDFTTTLAELAREGLAPLPERISHLDIVLAASAEPEHDVDRCLRAVLIDARTRAKNAW